MKKGFWIELVSMVAILSGCVTTSLVSANQETQTLHQSLIASGKRFGVDFSDTTFSRQSKCYSDPLQFYPNQNVNYRSICFYQDQSIATDIFWAKTKTITSPSEFVKRNLEVVAKDRASLGSTDTANRSATFLYEKNGITYHKVVIGESYKAIDGTFFVHTKEADAMGLVVVFSVKGFGTMTEEQVVALAEKMKAEVAIKPQSSLNFKHFSLVERVYADGGGGGGTDGGGSTGPALGSGTPGLGVTDSSGNAVGTGGGSTSGAGGSDPSGTIAATLANSGVMCGAGTPIMNAGTDRVVNGSSVALSGTFNGYAPVWLYQTPPNTGWVYVSGPNSISFSGYSFTPTGTYSGTIASTISGLVPGTYVFGLRITSFTEPGCWAGDDVTITVPAPMSGTLNASPLTCQIATGASSCPTTLTWSTANPQGTSGITRDGTLGTLYSGNADTKLTNVPYEADGSVTYRLYNNGTELGNATIAVTCASGKYDTSSSKCADPHVDSAVIDGEYYPPGTISLTCTNASTYSVTLDGNPFVAETAYTGPVVIQNVMQEGNYVIKCIQGTVTDQVTRFYDATPPASVIQLEASPITIGKDGKITTSWKTKYPTNACNLTAKVVCPNNACNAAQTTFESSLNSQLQSEKTDGNDPAGSRLITTAVKKVAPGHLGTDWFALGRKTLQISYTTDLVYDCGAGNKATKRIQVTKSELQ